jgi:hypothetical protein
LVSQYTDLKTGVTIPLAQEILYYKGMSQGTGNNQASGAYIFRPDGTTPFSIFSNMVTLELITVSSVMVSSTHAKEVL